MARPATKAHWREHAQRYEAVTTVDNTRFFLGYYSDEADAVNMINRFKRQAKGMPLEQKKEFAKTARETAKNLYANECRIPLQKRQRPVGKQLQDLEINVQQFMEQQRELNERLQQRLDQAESRLQYLEGGGENEAEALENTLAMQDELQ